MRLIPEIPIILSSIARELAAMRYRIAAICVITGIGLAMYTGVYSAIDSLFQTRDSYYIKNNVADLELRFIPDDSINLPLFDHIEGLNFYEYRLILPAQLEQKDNLQLTTTIIALDETSKQNINRLRIIEGNPLDATKPNEVVIEHNLAKYHNYRIGDKLHLRVGKDDYDLIVRGIAVSPEYLVAVANPNFLFPSKGSMAVVFSTLSLLQARLGFRLVNSLLFDLDEASNTQILIDTIVKRADQKLALERIIPVNEQAGHLFLDLDLNAFAIFVPAVVLIFSLTAIIVTFFLMFQWITTRRQQLGLLMALGYSKLSLLATSFLPALILTTGAAVAGILLAFLTLYGFGFTYANAISLPYPELTIQPGLIVTGIAGVVTALNCAIFLPNFRLLTLTPQDAVRGVGSGKNAELGRVVRYISKNLHGRIWLVYAIRNLLRSKAISFMTIFSVTLALSVSLSYFVSMTSFESSIMKSFTSDEWNIAIDFVSPTWDDELGEITGLDGIQTVDPFLRGVIQLKNGSSFRNSVTAGLNPATTLRRPEIIEGRLLRPDDTNAILLQQKLAAELDLHVGSTVTIKSRGTTFNAELVGIFASPIPGESIAPIATVRNWLDLQDQNTGMFLRAAPASLNSLALQLNKLDRVARVTRMDNLAQEISGIVEEALVIIYVAAAFSIAVAVLFVFTSTSFSILSKRSEYSMLRVLGFHDTVVVYTILTEVFLTGLLGAIFAIPLGYLISLYLNSYLSDAWFTIEAVVTARDIIIILAPACIIIPVAAWPSIALTLDTPLWKSLRERMFG